MSYFVNVIEISLKNKTPIYAINKRPTSNQGHIQTESEKLEKDISCKWRPNKARVAILISDKMDFEIKAKKRQKCSHSVVSNSVTSWTVAY